MTEKLRAYLYLHFCVFLAGFTAILGKLISLNAVPLVWWRVLLASSTLALIIPKKQCFPSIIWYRKFGGTTLALFLWGDKALQRLCSGGNDGHYVFFCGAGWPVVTPRES